MYISECSGPPRIYLGQIPKGYEGTRQTVELIARLAREGAMDFCVSQTAIADPALRTEVVFQKGKHE